MARYFECPIQCFSAAFDVLIRIIWKVIDFRSQHLFLERGISLAREISSTRRVKFEGHRLYIHIDDNFFTFTMTTTLLKLSHSLLPHLHVFGILPLSSNSTLSHFYLPFFCFFYPRRRSPTFFSSLSPSKSLCISLSVTVFFSQSLSHDFSLFPSHDLYLYITFFRDIPRRFPRPSRFILLLPPQSSTHSLSLSPSLSRSHFLSHFPVLLIRCKLFKLYHFPVVSLSCSFSFFLLLCHPLPLNLNSSFSCASALSHPLLLVQFPSSSH